MWKATRKTSDIMKRIAITLATVLLVIGAGASDAAAQCPGCRTVFEGRPELRTDVTSWETNTLRLGRGEAEEYTVRIVVDPMGNYFWETREMKPMAKVDAGMYTTYVSDAGYVRVVKDDVRNELKVQDLDWKALGVDMEYDYLEHLYTHLGTISYYGRRVGPR